MKNQRSTNAEHCHCSEVSRRHVLLSNRVTRPGGTAAELQTVRVSPSMLTFRRGRGSRRQAPGGALPARPTVDAAPHRQGKGDKSHRDDAHGHLRFPPRLSKAETRKTAAPHQLATSSMGRPTTSNPWKHIIIILVEVLYFFFSFNSLVVLCDHGRACGATIN
jgi:hypothetical protein